MMTRRRKQFYLTAALLMLLALALRLLRFGDALEYDEIWTLESYAAGPVSRIFTDLALPNNHPLNSLLVKLIALTGAPVTWIRLGSLAAGMLAVPLAGITALGLWKRRSTALWAMFFLAVLPGAVFYSQQARGYSLQLCLLLAYTAGLVTVRRHPVPGVIGILLGAIGSMLTLPTSAFYLGAIGCVCVFRCRNQLSRYLPGAAALACGGLFCLIWVVINLDNFAANQNWGIPIDSPTAFLEFLTNSMVLSVPFYLYLPALAALLLGFRRSWPVLWLWGCLIAAALLFNGGPSRTYLPLVAATALAAAGGCTLLSRRLPKLKCAILILFAAAGLYSIAAACREPYPEWYALHDTIRELPEEITVLLPANDTRPLAWNNYPDAYREQLRRIAQLPQGRSRTLLILSRNPEPVLNGGAGSGAEREFPLDVPGIPVRLGAWFGHMYGLEELKGAPDRGDTVIAFIRPLPEKAAIELFCSFMELPESLSLNLWLCPSITTDQIKYRYYLMGAKIEDPGRLNWEQFLNQYPGATAVFRLVPPGKKK